MSEAVSSNSLEARHLRNMIMYGLIFAVLFFVMSIGLAAALKTSAVQEMLSASLFKTMNFTKVAQVLEAQGASDFGLASMATWVLTIIGFTIGAVIGWSKE